MKLNNHILRASLVTGVLVSSFVGCTSERAFTNVDAQSPTGEETPAKTPVIQASGDGKTFVREDGWQIPQFSSGEKEETVSSVNLDGRDIKVWQLTQQFTPFVVTDEPFLSIGSAIGKTQIRSVIEYRTARGVFCYRVTVNRVFVDDTNTVRSTQGVVFSYYYYDEDGDGKFETLSLSATDPKVSQRLSIRIFPNGSPVSWVMRMGRNWGRPATFLGFSS